MTTKNFNHRPFSMLVEHVGEMDIVTEIGDVGLSLNVKLTHAHALELFKMLSVKLNQDPDTLITFNLTGIKK